MEEEENTCALCLREMECTEHHLIPCSTHQRGWVKRAYTKEQMDETIPACDNCHRTVHRFFTNKELALEFNTVDKLIANEEFAKYVKWVSKQRRKVVKTAARK
jgi:predicted HNH restriction endonuclease